MSKIFMENIIKLLKFIKEGLSLKYENRWQAIFNLKVIAYSLF